MFQKLKYGLIGLLLGAILFIPLYNVLSSDMREISPWYQSGTSVCLAIPGSKVGIGTSTPLELLSLYGAVPSISLFDSTHPTLHSDWKIQTYSPANPQEADTYLLLGYNVGATPSSNRKTNGLPCAQLILEPQYFYGGNPSGTSELHWDVAIPANGAITWITPFLMSYNFDTNALTALLQSSGGGVIRFGIGTPTPAAPLDVYGDAYFRGSFRVYDVDNVTYGAIYHQGGAAGQLHIDALANEFYYHGSDHLFWCGGSWKVYINPSGYLGVNTLTPPHLLSVIGGSIAVGSYTDGSNYEYFKITQTAGLITLSAQTLGTGTDDIDILFSPAGVGVTKFSNTVANDVTACVFGATLGPVGANVAIQGWLKIKDSGGTVRYIPYW